jgi:CBS domain-containing protein
MRKSVLKKGGNMAKLPIVRDHMDKSIATLLPDAGILDAVGFLLEKGLTGAPVADKTGRLIGILTEKDCLRLVAAGVGGDLPRGTVADFMTANPETIPPDMDVYYAAGLFLAREFRRFPVVENGRLVGTITRFDILRVIRENLAAAQ